MDGKTSLYLDTLFSLLRLSKAERKVFLYEIRATDSKPDYANITIKKAYASLQRKALLNRIGKGSYQPNQNIWNEDIKESKEISIVFNESNVEIKGDSGTHILFVYSCGSF